MEHLPRPGHAQSITRCRYIANTYSNILPQGFLDYAKRTNFKFLRLLRGHFDNGVQPEQLEGIFQAWLYFCPLHDIFGEKFSMQDFICQDLFTGDDYITTQSLSKYIMDWRQSYNVASEIHRERTAKEIATLLQSVNYVLNRMKTAVNVDWNPLKLISSDFELVVRVLIQTLEFELFPEQLPRQRMIDESGTEICLSLRQDMLDNCWCPNQVNMLSHTLDVPSFYYASLLGPDASNKDHSDCSNDLCKASQVDLTTYQTAHVDTNCQCAFIGPNSEQIAAIIEDQHLPVIVADCNLNDQELSMEVFCEGMQYVAISHVWSDGLGNPVENKLPTCQVRRLAHHVADTIPGLEKAMFWCDTLCVPTQPAQLRRKAIWKMRDIYDRARAVLIIDASLSTISCNAPAEEIMMRVTCSGWMRRLWTFQENVLAKKLFAVFQDGVVNIDRTSAQLLRPGWRGKPVTQATYRTSVGMEAAAFYRTFIRDQRLGGASGTGVDIGSVWDSVQWRMTSWPSDEPICLATALNVELPLILETDEADRMKKLFSRVSGWPPYLIFATFDRMSGPGWRWAPQTLLHPNSMSSGKVHHMNATTIWDKEGLIVEFPGFIVDMGQDNNGDEPLVNIGRCFHIREQVSETWYSCFRDDQTMTAFDPTLLPMSGLRRPAIIVSCPIEALLGKSSTVQLWDGLLVDIYREEPNVLFSNYIVKVLIGLCPPMEAADMEKDRQHFTPSQTNRAQDLTFEFDVLEKSAKQKWCIG